MGERDSVDNDAAGREISPFARKGEGAKAEAPTAAIVTSATETLLRMLAGGFRCDCYTI